MRNERKKKNNTRLSFLCECWILNRCHLSCEKIPSEDESLAVDVVAVKSLEDVQQCRFSSSLIDDWLRRMQLQTPDETMCTSSTAHASSKKTVSRHLIVFNHHTLYFMLINCVLFRATCGFSTVGLSWLKDWAGVEEEGVMLYIPWASDQDTPTLSWWQYHQADTLTSTIWDFWGLFPVYFST